MTCQVHVCVLYVRVCMLLCKCLCGCGCVSEKKREIIGQVIVISRSIFKISHCSSRFEVLLCRVVYVSV